MTGTITVTEGTSPPGGGTRNESGEEHEIDSTDEPDDADDFRAELAPGDRFRFTPDRTGTWVYRCKEHGDEEDMTIVVR